MGWHDQKGYHAISNYEDSPFLPFVKKITKGSYSIKFGKAVVVDLSNKSSQHPIDGMDDSFSCPESSAKKFWVVVHLSGEGGFASAEFVNSESSPTSDENTIVIFICTIVGDNVTSTGVRSDIYIGAGSGGTGTYEELPLCVCIDGKAVQRTFLVLPLTGDEPEDACGPSSPE